MFAQRTKFTRTSGPLVAGFVGLLMFGVSAFGQTGEADSPASLDDVTSFSLTPFYQEGGGGSDDWDVSGPVRMRSADPEETGELQIKNIFGYSTSSDGSDDDLEYELELEWGFLPNHHMILELPVELGDGEVEGNGDITLGWHWRLWTEQDWIPAFAMRNLVRLPSGVDSDGVDYEFRGLFTKSITPNQLRLQFSPSFKVVNGDIHDGDRSFQWEVYAGFDYRLSEAAALNLAYLYGSSESNGAGDQHSIELGLDWDIAEHRMLAFGTKLGLDGDDEGDNWGFKVSYIFSLDAPSFGG